MNQPPESMPSASAQTGSTSTRQTDPRPQWRRPAGVAAGTWEYVGQRSIADHYDAFVADTPLCRLDLRILAELFTGSRTPGGEIILDLGCGSGRAALPLATRGYAVVGIDLSQAMLEVLSSKSIQAAAKLVLPLRANLVQLDCLADGTADHAVCLFSTLGMIQGRQHRRQMLRHVSRVVRPGGSLLVHVHHRWAALREHAGMTALAQSWWRSLRRRDCEFGDATYTYRGLERMFLHRFSRHELLQDLKRSGWSVRTVSRLSIDGSEISRGYRIAGGFLVHASR